MAKTDKIRKPASKVTKAPKVAKVAKKIAKITGQHRPAASGEASAVVLDRLWQTVLSRRNADPAVSHSARLLSRGTAKVAQKFGEEAVECLIEAVAGNHAALVGESADVLYHLLVLWVDAGLEPTEVWAELARREGISGIAEKASRPVARALRVGLRKLP